ncbi:histidine ammonia-lyase [Candidatus Woesearchaeota archaeon]|nr:histidine ammonia-lyase [Candidatus Woesearchaeota archaeon]
MKKKVIIDGEALSVEDVVAVSRFGATVSIDKAVQKRIRESRDFVDRLVSENKVVYGITTGCGPMCNRLIPPENAEVFQKNLIRSHAAGAGRPLPVHEVRAAMLTRANSLTKGCSGIRISVIETLLEMLNKNVHPFMPCQGSVGASGDLVHLAHMALCLMGEGKVFYNDKLVDCSVAFRKAGIKKVTLSYKEGLALINGTSAMSGIAAINVYDSFALIRHAEISAAMAVESLKGTSEAFEKQIHEVKPHPGQVECAANILALLKGSRLVRNPVDLRKALQFERESNGGVFKAENEVQNPYTLRCTPQILGAVKDTVGFVRRVVEIELNSVTDNPLIFHKDMRVLHGGNFHGQHIAMAMDYLSIALTELGLLSERRLARLLDEKLNYELTPFLILGDPGFQNGFMGAQYLPSSLVAENRVLCNPVSVFSVTTNANNQEVVSMGTVAARKARDVLDNSQKIVAVELMCVAQALDVAGVDGAGKASKAAYDAIRSRVHRLDGDRVIYTDVQKMIEMMRNEEIVKSVEKVIS